MLAVDKVFILSTPGHAEKKLELFRKRLEAITLVHAGTDIEIPEASENLTAMHHQAWHKAAKAGHSATLILEENFLPTANHYQVLDTDEPWDMIYLGRTSHGADMPLEGGLVKPGRSGGSFAYILSSTAAGKLEQAHRAHPAATPSELLATLTGQANVLAPMLNFISTDKQWTMALSGYTPRHPQLYEAFTNPAAPAIRQYIHTQILQKEYDLICDEPIDNVFTFPLFTPLFCSELIEEAEHYGQWTSYRGNNSPSTDILLNSIGFHAGYTQALQTYVYPLFMHKYQLKGDGWLKLNAQNFVVRYLSEHQGHLGLHNDGSYLSMVVTLNTEYEGGGTIFPKFKKLIKHDQPGYAAIHPGLVGYYHGARPVTKGRRYILASFMFPGDAPPIVDGIY
jgi:hypothetical protein